jgi:predicted dinucleotide-binding enzyme
MTTSRRALLAFAAAGVVICAAGSAPAQTTAPLKIGVIGSGRLGGAVGALFAKAGHPVLFSSRHPEELQPLAEKTGPNARTGTVADAIAFGDVILIAVPYSAIPQLSAEYRGALAGKIILDASNPVVSRDGEPAKAAQEKGVGEASAAYFPGAKLVRAFNSFGAGTFTRESNREGEKYGVPIAGDDPAAMKVAAQLVRDAGFEPVEVPLARAREFAPPGPLFTKAMTVSALRKALGVQ